jgi:hypothetical protein
LRVLRVARVTMVGLVPKDPKVGWASRPLFRLHVRLYGGVAASCNFTGAGMPMAELIAVIQRFHPMPVEVKRCK